MRITYEELIWMNSHGIYSSTGNSSILQNGGKSSNMWVELDEPTLKWLIQCARDKEKEEIVIANNPIVKDAYTTYQTLLSLLAHENAIDSNI
jgi:hypothetical protein